MSEARNAKPLSIAVIQADGGQATLECADSSGERYDIKLSTMDIMSLMSALAHAFEAVKGHPNAKSSVAPAIHRLQFEETAGTVFLRVFLGPQLFHEYSAEKGSNLARILLSVGDEMAKDVADRSTHPEGDKGTAH